MLNGGTDYKSDRTDYECLLFCSVVSNYTPNIPELNTLQKLGWMPLRTSGQFSITDNGYFGIAYYKLDESNKTIKVCIAHRGTRLDEIENILAEIAITEEKTPKILHTAQHYTSELGIFTHWFFLEQYTSNRYLLNEVIHTGFSLGGFIAEACIIDKLDISKAITFDAPGIGKFVDALGANFNKSELKKRVVNYLTVPNLVNTCHDHLGEIRQVIANFPSQKNEVKFTVDFHDIGYMDERYSSSELGGNPEKQKIAVERAKKRKSAEVLINQLAHTKETHSVEAIIKSSSHEVRIPYKKVHKWPCAENEIIRGKFPLLSSVAYFSDNDGFISCANVVSIGGQGLTHITVQLLWELTKEDKDGQETGVTGFHHYRSNEVKYPQSSPMIYSAGGQAVINSHSHSGSQGTPTPLPVPSGNVPKNVKNVTKEKRVGKSFP